MLSLVRSAGLENAIKVDSAGTSAFHVGERADRRSRAAAEVHGVDLPSRACQFVAADFERFDYIIAMDTSNKRKFWPSAQKHRPSKGQPALILTHNRRKGQVYRPVLWR